MYRRRFRPFRLKHGIYGQRQPGVQMVRTKIPGGLLTSRQIDAARQHRRRFRRRPRAPDHAAEHPVSLRAARARAGSDAHAGRRRADQSRGLLQHGPQRDRLPAGPGIAQDEVFDVRPYAQRLAYAFLRKDLTQSLPRKFKFAFDGCASHDCIQGAINDVGLRAVIRDGKRGFRMMIARRPGTAAGRSAVAGRVRAGRAAGQPHRGGDPRLQPVRQSQEQEQGAPEVRDARARLRVAEGADREGIRRTSWPTAASQWPELVPEGFGGYQSNPAPLGNGALLPVVNPSTSGDAAYDAWLETNVEQQKQTGYAAVTVRVEQGNLTGDQFRGIARLAADAGDGLVRVAIEQNLLLAFIPLARLPRVYAALEQLGLAERGRARDRRHHHLPRRVLLQPGADQDDEPGRGAPGGGAPVRRPAGASGSPSRPAAAPTRAASTGSATSASTATRARSTARKSRTTRCSWAAGTTSRASCASAWPSSRFRRAWRRWR